MEAPRIQTDTLWVLAGLFAVLGVVYLLLTFWMRNRISAKREAIRLKKHELAPMISNFLFYQHDSEDEDRDTYIRMKIEIRELLKTPLNREVLSEVLMDLRMDVMGDARERLFVLFQDLGLHQDSFRKLQSWRWERISKGILELTEMQVEKAYPFIRKFINDRRGVIRKQAQLATVMLREEGISYFLDTAHYSISEWQQLKLLEILRLREDYNPPRFRVWLTSENRDVVLFALRLIRHYRQNDAEMALIKLLGHRNQVVKGAALECIREFRFQSALQPVMDLFPRVNEELKLLILDTIGLIGSESELGFLESRAAHDRNFIIRSKARAVMNLLKPNSALPEVQTAEFMPGADPGESTPKDPPIFPDLELPGETSIEKGALQHGEEVSWEADFGEVSQIPEAGESFEAAPLANGPQTSESDSQQQEWEEDLAIFEVCFREELEDILSDLDPAEEPVGQLPLDFLPIIENADETALPEELAEMEVVAEWVVPEGGWHGTASTLEPAPAVDLRLSLQEDFLPWVVSEPTPSGAGSEASPTGPSEDSPDGFADLPNRFWEPVFELDEMPQPATTPAGEPYFKQAPDFRDNPQQRYSIFRDLFRQIDAEAKRILLDELVAVGEEKEWAFLHELLAAPDPIFVRQVNRAIKSLGEKLGLEGVAPQPGPESAARDTVQTNPFGFELDRIGEWDQAGEPKNQRHE